MGPLSGARAGLTLRSRKVVRVVFLDVDGVLAPFGRANPEVLDAASVSRARRLARHARLVSVSMWPLERVREAGVPVHEELDVDYRRAPAAVRLRGIADYLQRHPTVKHWASVDDYQERELDHLERRSEVLEDGRGVSLREDGLFVRCDWVAREAVHRPPWQVYLEEKGLTEPAHPQVFAEGDGLTDAAYRRVVDHLRPELAAEIERLRRTEKRREKELSTLEPEDGPPSVDTNSPYDHALDQYARTSWALACQLRARGSDVDLADADWLARGIGGRGPGLHYELAQLGAERPGKVCTACHHPAGAHEQGNPNFGKCRTAGCKCTGLHFNEKRGCHRAR